MTSSNQSSGHKLLIAGVAAMLVGACAGSGDKYPSLAIRDAERVTGQFTPDASDIPPIAPVASTAELADILASAASAHRNFIETRPSAQRIIEAASGSGSESDIRSRALVALADLTSIRGNTALALANLDRLEAEAATGFAPVEDIRQAQEEVARLVNEQDAVIDSLGATLR